MTASAVSHSSLQQWLIPTAYTLSDVAAVRCVGPSLFLSLSLSLPLSLTLSLSLTD